MALSNKACTPCRGGVAPLTRAEADALADKTDGWALKDDARLIGRRFAFEDFASAMAFAQRVADIAEAEGHHPELLLGWGYCTVRFWTHKIDGLHENDFIMAAKVNDLVT